MTAATSRSNRLLPLLLILFIGSGCAALIYEVVWFQMLSLIVGSSAISIGVLLGTFMGGMCIGSLLLHRYMPRDEHPLRVYALLELAIAICGIAILFGLPYAGGLYVAVGGAGFSGLLVKGLFSGLCLLLPTICMGATLPAVARWIETSPKGVAWLGFFYGGNIAGAVGGCLLAGFYLLSKHDIVFATFTAVGFNVVVAVIGMILARVTPYEAAPAAPMHEPVSTWFADGWPVYVAIALSGMTALGAEVLWTRLLSLLLGATVYTFSLIIAAILAGLGIGSAIGSSMGRTSPNPRRALGWCQALLMIAIALGAYSAVNVLPYWPVNPILSSRPTALFEIDFVRCLWVITPAALLWGASFPLALAAVVRGTEDPARLVGRVYAANTVGGIVGSILTALVLLPWKGTQWGQRSLIAIAGIAALLLLVLPAGVVGERAKFTGRGLGVAAMLVALLIGGSMLVDRPPGVLIGYGRLSAVWLGHTGEFIYTGEGMNSSMAVSRLDNGVLNYHNAGKVQASSEPQDMRLQRMLGHLTTLIPAHARNVLVIGCGAGVTAGAVSISPDVESETIAEIEPLVPKVVSKFFGAHNYNVVDNPKVHVRIDDARHFLLTTDQKFDAITSDPFDPWVKGAATLYSREFFEIAKKHLNPGGVVTIFVQLYESGEPAVKSEMATFFEAFPNAVVWGNTSNGEGYDMVLMGQVEPSRINLDTIDARLSSPRYAQVAQSLREIGFNSWVDLFSTYAGRASDLGPYLKDAQVNRDRNLRLEYLAGLGVNVYAQDEIYRNILQYRRYPEGLFTGSPERLAALAAAGTSGQ
ncbi:MAG TPA: fused MFS/spermidine synthase [Gemmatimonadales bacterium]|jgi:spermidine synthase